MSNSRVKLEGRLTFFYLWFPLWGTPTHHALHAFMVLVALWPARSPRLSDPNNNRPGLSFTYHAQGPRPLIIASQEVLVPSLSHPYLQIQHPQNIILLLPRPLMAATMTTTPCLGNNATSLGNNTTLLSACLVTMPCRLAHAWQQCRHARVTTPILVTTPRCLAHAQ